MEIGRFAFRGCTGLTSVTIPKSVTEIGGGTFNGTPWLKNLGEFAVVNGILLAYQGAGGDVAIPKGITEIGSAAFDACTGLTSVTILESVTEIGVRAFEGCTGLTGVTIPARVKKIGDGVFYVCRGLTSVTILEGVKEIGRFAFEGCTSLTSVVLPKSVTKIDESAFDGCCPALVALHTLVSEFDAAYKPNACAGFAKAYLDGMELDEETKAGYLKYIKGQKKRLYSVVVQHEELLQLMLDEKMLVRKDIDPLLEECDKQNNIAAKAAVLVYAGRN